MSASSVRAGDAVGLVGELLNGRPRGFGTQWTLLKTAIACAVSFAIAQQLGGTELAIFAPVLALTTVQASVYGTVSQGIQRVLGNIAGVVLATIFIDLVGQVTWWSVGVAVLVSAYGASLLPIGFAGQVQIPLSVLLVIALGPTTEGYGLFRAIDCAIGGAVGIAVALVLPERATTRDAVEVHARWLNALAEQLRAVANDLRRPARELLSGADHPFSSTSRALHMMSSEGREATAYAAESVHFNVRARGAADEIDRLRASERQLVRMSLQVRMVSYTIDQLYDRPGEPPRLTRGTLADLLDMLAKLMERSWASRDASPLSAEIETGLAQAVEQVSRGLPGPLPVLQSVTLLGRLDQLREEIVDERLAAILDPDVSNDAS